MAFQLILCALGSAGLFTFLQFLITRKDKKENNSEEIMKTLAKLEKDSVRTQMLVLMANYDDKQGVMKLAQRYFDELKGDWYMTGLFNQWLTKNNMGKPEWFNPNN